MKVAGDSIDSHYRTEDQFCEESKVLSGGTGEASQETLTRHFQKIIGLSPIVKNESEIASQFTIRLIQQ